MRTSNPLSERRSLDELTAGVDLLAQLRHHRFRRLDITVPDGHQLLWFDVFPLAGALVLMSDDVPLWVCRWQLVDRVAVIHDWRAFWYTHQQDLTHLPLEAICWLSCRYLVKWKAPNGGHFWRRCLREARVRGLSVNAGAIGQP
ncbi:hypothetical protein GNZ06_10055 [Aeromonas jandaei]|uniref:hypothetical protein n=1 Tax=Aeromonas jandaei TaxID=650 RepID=UPI0019331E76|nr:hypothetical protein [Aeromonas jandaei]MBM0490502.1 hypothetical protein [Aeromonas jandaei]MBM0569139.1 hypothetical protein [Aeromonas jandaei]